MKVEKDEFLIDGGKSAVFNDDDETKQTVSDLSCGTAANSRQLDVRYD